jgi:hypothetical protein
MSFGSFFKKLGKKIGGGVKRLGRKVGGLGHKAAMLGRKAIGAVGSVAGHIPLVGKTLKKGLRRAEVAMDALDAGSHLLQGNIKQAGINALHGVDMAYTGGLGNKAFQAGRSAFRAGQALKRGNALEAYREGKAAHSGGMDIYRRTR